MGKATVIICAYNEEDTIGSIIMNVSEFSLIDEIIVVNDGSTDKTEEIINLVKTHVKITHIHLPQNRGKGYAMVKGIENSKSQNIIFFDADISNIKEEHLQLLLFPLLNKEAEMILGQPSGTLINHTLNPFKPFTGQRAINKNDIFPILNKMKKSRFGVETLMNLYYQSNNKTIKYVLLDGLLHPTKFEKTSAHLAMKEFMIEGHQIVSTALINCDLIMKSIKNSMSNNCIRKF